MQRDIVRMILFLGALAILVLAVQYRYLILSKLNISMGTGESEQALGLKRIKDIPLGGNPTRFNYMSIDPDRRLLFIARQGESRVIVFHINRQMVIAEVSEIGSVRGVFAVPDLRRVFAAATASNQVVTIDSATFRVVARVDAGEYPDGLTYVPDYGKLFVSDERGGTITVIDPVTGRWQSSIDLGGKAGKPVFDPILRRVFVTAQARNQLVEIDARTNTVIKKVELAGCGGPHGLYVDGVARLAFVGCTDNAQLAILDLETDKITGFRSVGDAPDVLAFDERLRRLYVAAESGFVTVFQEKGRNLEPRGGAYLAPNAHTLAVDSITHRIYIPLENVNGHPALRILAPFDAISPE